MVAYRPYGHSIPRRFMQNYKQMCPKPDVRAWGLRQIHSSRRTHISSHPSSYGHLYFVTYSLSFSSPSCISIIIFRLFYVYLPKYIHTYTLLSLHVMYVYVYVYVYVYACLRVQLCLANGASAHCQFLPLISGASSSPPPNSLQTDAFSSDGNNLPGHTSLSLSLSY